LLPAHAAPLLLRPLWVTSKIDSVPPEKGQRVRTPHPTFVGGGETAEGTYEGDEPDHVVPSTLDGHSERIAQGRVRYADGATKVWPREAIEPI
jgi:hypothetical protein